MLTGYLTTISRSYGILNLQNILPRIAFTARQGNVANGYDQLIFIKKMEGSTASVVVARPKSAVCATGNGMGQKNAPRTKRQTSSSRQLSKLDGNAATTAGRW
jgi:hypothetical protein